MFARFGDTGSEKMSSKIGECKHTAASPRSLLIRARNTRYSISLVYRVRQFPLLVCLETLRHRNVKFSYMMK